MKRSELREEKRMYWLADIVSYINSSDQNHLAVLKIAVHSSQPKMMWNEAHIMRALRGHPSIVPFEKFVVDDIEHQLVDGQALLFQEEHWKRITAILTSGLPG